MERHGRRASEASNNSTTCEIAMKRNKRGRSTSDDASGEGKRSRRNSEDDNEQMPAVGTANGENGPIIQRDSQDEDDSMISPPKNGEVNNVDGSREMESPNVKSPETDTIQKDSDPSMANVTTKEGENGPTSSAANEEPVDTPLSKQIQGEMSADETDAKRNDMIESTSSNDATPDGGIRPKNSISNKEGDQTADCEQSKGGNGQSSEGCEASTPMDLETNDTTTDGDTNRRLCQLDDTLVTEHADERIPEKAELITSPVKMTNNSAKERTGETNVELVTSGGDTTELSEEQQQQHQFPPDEMRSRIVSDEPAVYPPGQPSSVQSEEQPAGDTTNNEQSAEESTLSLSISYPQSPQNSPAPSIGQLKMALFLEATKVHRGQGVERIFATYWESLERYITLNSHGGRIRSDLSSCVGVEGALSGFLKTRKMKRLHNKLVLGKCFWLSICAEVCMMEEILMFISNLSRGSK